MYPLEDACIRAVRGGDGVEWISTTWTEIQLVPCGNMSRKRDEWRINERSQYIHTMSGIPMARGAIMATDKTPTWIVPWNRARRTSKVHLYLRGFPFYDILMCATELRTKNDIIFRMKKYYNFWVYAMVLVSDQTKIIASSIIKSGHEV